MTKLYPTADQTVGPYYAIGMAFDGSEQIVPAGTPGAIVLSGYVYDGNGAPVPDAVVEIWQTDAAGNIPTETGSIVRKADSFSGFGRSGSDEEGHYEFTTLLPAPTAEGKPAFFAVIVFARGLLARLHTRIYVPGPALEGDAFLSGLTPERRATLIATEVPGGLRHDIHLQGEKETVFLAFN
ncbi:protocatechuate 3,4-dioxygenase subunit alpha [Pseudolysinimonas sp.]|jgi:protocatechuate 3,4-dioxygenase alpha subunit|uniref:protocatechuate 3,4-dioxygenase subunit alpha n=1 Tax=Pseudolysinimonas sp. TaxID=2680009 RepID=UPI0037847F22